MTSQYVVEKWEHTPGKAGFIKVEERSFQNELAALDYISHEIASASFVKYEDDHKWIVASKGGIQTAFICDDLDIRALA